MLNLIEELYSQGHRLVQASEPAISRAAEFPAAENVIKVAIGMRRSGKTYLVYQKIKELLAEGVDPKQILFINFEDDRILPMNAKEMGQLLDSFFSLFPENHDRRVYFFLDEVQNVDGWYTTVRRFFDSNQCQIYLTGSSAKLLSKEINTSLRGRSLSVEVWPYSFEEFLTAHSVSIDPALMGSQKYDKLKALLLKYLKLGGFPAIQTMPAEEQLASVKGYVDTVILRDIVERYGVENIPVLQYMISSILANASTCFSVTKFFNDMKSRGLKISKSTLLDYLEYIEDAYLGFGIQHYEESIRARSNRPKKVYAVDSSLIHLNSLSTNEMLGKLFENLIYLDLRRDGREVYYYKTIKGYEVDFVTVTKYNTREIIQVCWDLDDEETMAREQRALDAAKEELNMPGRLITPREYLRLGPELFKQEIG